MKTTRIIALSLFMSVALSISARTYSAGEKVYVNSDQSSSEASGQNFNWANDNAKLFLYFFQSWQGGNDTQWMQLTKEDGNVYSATWGGTAYYDRVIVVRKDPSGTSGNWDHVWNQSCDINIPDNGDCDCNYIDIYCGSTANWKGYAPKASTLPSASDIAASGVTIEKISICPNDLKGPFSLRVKLNADKTAYVYSDVQEHGWYKSFDGTSWTEVLPGTTGIAMDGIDSEKDINKNQLPNDYTGGILYYYLHSNIPSGRRLIQLNTNSTSCDLDCEITSFETAVSNVNADDNTYTLDGMVAFGKASGDLVISCDGVSITIDNPMSPQTFSLYGVPAATEDGKKTTALAYFTGDQSNCSKSIVIDVPNAREAVVKQSVDSLIGKPFVLTPKDYDPANTYIWLVNGDTIEGAPQVLLIDAYDKDSTTTYTYKEYYPASGSMEDIIKNGDYEEATGYGTYKQKSTISDNNFWGIYDNSASQMNFYDTCSLAEDEKSNGFAVVRSANNFYPTYAKITAKSGNNFALFDAATGTAGANKKAWYATTATSEKLKLQKGTTYVLSFWAANVNNYGEMDNAARFKFRIEYNSKVWESRELNLADPEFRNNIWHQCSQTFYADEDCNDVTISVVNLNNNTLNVGNDFALDDIQFHPISTVSKVVKSQQEFIVTAHEPQVDALTATTQNMLCNADSFTVNMSVKYRNAQGVLCIRDVDRDTVYEFNDVPAKAIEVQGTYNCAIKLSDEYAAVRSWEAYFQLKPTNVKTAQSVAPVRYSCEKKDTTLCEGETITWKGTVYPQTPYIGTDTFTSGYDSLILTINAIPRIAVGTVALTCDSASEIRIPFTISAGAPDTYDVAVNGAHYAGAVEGTEIVFSLTSMEAGDYSAVVTVGATGTTCESMTNVNFTIAISGQLLSKWTDVLFVSNKENRYVGYQWLADGVELTGETQQRLYDPNGLSGTSILYQCRLTTTDGKTLITCPQTFDEVTPSRTVTTGGASQVIGIYDAMGRPVSGTLGRGVYIVVTEIEGKRITSKMVIHE